MAPAGTPARKRRENQYFDIGVQGRKTGITVPENARDEHGIENMDGIFSSPEKSPVKDQTLRNGNATTITSSVQDKIHGSVTQPVEAMSSRRLLRSTKSTFPPPSGRSPIKTNIGSSPRRQSSAAPNSLARLKAAPPLGRSTSHPVARRLDFSADDPRPSIERPTRNQQAMAPQDIYELRPTPPDPSPRGQKRSRDETLRQESAVDEDAFAANLEAEGIDQDGHMLAVEDDDMDMLPDEDYPILDNDLDDPDHEETEMPLDSSPTTRKEKKGPSRKRNSNASRLDEPQVEKKRGKGRTRKTDAASASVGAAASGSKKKGRSRNSGSFVEDSSTLSHAQPQKKNRVQALKSSANARSRVASAEEEYVESITDDTTEDSHQVSASPPPRGQRKNKPSKLYVREDAYEHDGGERPAKRTKQSSSRAAPSERDPNIRAPSAAVAQTSNGKTLWTQPDRRPVPRTLQILRQTTPMDENAVVTRSGRRSVRPLDYWAGETINRAHDGTMLNVLRAESVELTPPKKKRGGQRRTRRPNPRAMEAIDEEEEADDLEEWEVEGEVIQGFVRSWDPEYGVGLEDEEYEQDIAYSSAAIQTRDVVGAEFQYAKIISLPFFGGGVVDIPPNGFKRAKNSRKMHMLFFVASGKVSVNVADIQFSISKGGVWQVPRGNNYSIDNPGPLPARLFFAQGCEVEREVDPELE